jgi:hypothetical protein
MKGLLSNAVYTNQYNRWKPQELTSWEQLRQVFKRLMEDQDPVPLVGTTAGMMLGSVVIIVFFMMWYKCLQRNRSLSKEGREYFNALSLMSRPTSDDSQYKRRRQKTKAPSPWWWTRLARYITRFFTRFFTRSSGTKLIITGPACYLLYEPNGSSGQLVQKFSKTPLKLEADEQRAIVAVWKPASHISSHKFTQNAGRSVLIGNCTVGFQGQHNYSNGVCQFIKSAFANGGGTITLLERDGKAPTNPTTEEAIAAAMPMDVYLYMNDTRPQYQTLLLETGKTRRIPSNTLAAACMPQKTEFHSKTIVDMYRWLADAERLGSSIRF